jgi:excisionase family DNA binding protein
MTDSPFKTKKEAADFLNLSIRAVERAVSKGKLGVQYEKGKHGNVALFEQAELKRYKSELEGALHVRRPTFESALNEHSDTPDSQSSTALASVPEVSRDIDGQLIPNLIKFVQHFSNPIIIDPLHVSVMDKLTLKLSEAAALSGLSQQFLLADIRQGKLNAEKRGRGWNIKRADLDGYTRKL